MRRVLSVLVLLALAHAAAAQMPPSIRKPIESARNAANATNAQIRATDKVAGPAQSSAQAKAPATKPPAPAAAKAQAPAARTPAASAAAAKAVSAQDTLGRIRFEREVFTYVSEGRRDPFSSPIETGEIRPLVADLRVVGIIFDPRGRNSVVVMRDMSTQQQYRAKVGQILGRAKVTQIRPQEIVMTIDEYGFSRQEILRLSVQQTKGKP